LQGLQALTFQPGAAKPLTASTAPAA